MPQLCGSVARLSRGCCFCLAWSLRIRRAGQSRGSPAGRAPARGLGAALCLCEGLVTGAPGEGLVNASPGVAGTLFFRLRGSLGILPRRVWGDEAAGTPGHTREMRDEHSRGVSPTSQRHLHPGRQLRPRNKRTGSQGPLGALPAWAGAPIPPLPAPALPVCLLT